MYKKLSCHRQTVRRISANTVAWLTSWKQGQGGNICTF